MAVIDNVKTFNSTVRTLLAMLVVGGGGAAAWFGWNKYNAAEHDKQELEQATVKIEQFEQDLKQRSQELDDARSKIVGLNADLVKKEDVINTQVVKINDLNTKVAEQADEIAHLDTAIGLLKVDRRLARLTAVKKGTDDQGDDYTDIEFVEVNDEGKSIDEPRKFRIMGDVVYIDYWVAKFNDEFIEEADLARSTSISLFRRIFGERQQAIDGYVLDEPGTRPTAYSRGSKMSDFEKDIWDNFWEIANDEKKARELGIRAAHGEAVSIKVEEGKSYRLMLRASDGLSIIPDVVPLPLLNEAG